MRLSYHGWAATLLVLAFVLAGGGIAFGMTPTSVDNGDGTAIACGTPWMPSGAETAQCAATFGLRGPIGLVLTLSGLLLFGGILLIGMLVAGVRHALADAHQHPNVPAPDAPEVAGQ